VGARLRIRDLTVAYDGHPAIHHIGCDVAPGSLTAIVGPNGAGKSTLVKAIVGLVRTSGGTIERDPPSSPLAYLPQQAELERGFPITVGDAVLLGRWRQLGWFKAATQSDRAAVTGALESVGLGGFEQRGVSTLSVGQFQRMLFARLMLQDAPMILLDEPFAAVDARTIRDLTAIILQWHAEGRTVLAVLHDLDLVAESFPETILLARRLVAAGPTQIALTPETLRAARAMAEAWDEAAEPCPEPARRAMGAP
jgi:zinc/manganese transport system ATP-binding protein